MKLTREKIEAALDWVYRQAPLATLRSDSSSAGNRVCGRPTDLSNQSQGPPGLSAGKPRRELPRGGLTKSGGSGPPREPSGPLRQLGSGIHPQRRTERHLALRGAGHGRSGESSRARGLAIRRKPASDGEVHERDRPRL